MSARRCPRPPACNRASNCLFRHARYAPITPTSRARSARICRSCCTRSNQLDYGSKKRGISAALVSTLSCGPASVPRVLRWARRNTLTFQSLAERDTEHALGTAATNTLVSTTGTSRSSTAILLACCCFCYDSTTSGEPAGREAAPESGVVSIVPAVGVADSSLPKVCPKLFSKNMSSNSNLARGRGVYPSFG